MKHLEAIAELLALQGLGVFEPDGLGGDIFIDVLPESPDSVIALRTSGGTGDELAPNWGLDSSFPSVQIIVRSDKMNIKDAQDRAESIYKAVRRLGLPYDGGRIFDSVAQYPALLGTDQNGRAEYSINLQLELNN